MGRSLYILILLSLISHQGHTSVIDCEDGYKEVLGRLFRKQPVATDKVTRKIPKRDFTPTAVQKNLEKFNQKKTTNKLGPLDYLDHDPETLDQRIFHRAPTHDDLAFHQVKAYTPPQNRPLTFHYQMSVEDSGELSSGIRELDLTHATEAAGDIHAKAERIGNHSLVTGGERLILSSEGEFMTHLEIFRFANETPDRAKKAIALTVAHPESPFTKGREARFLFFNRRYRLEESQALQKIHQISSKEMEVTLDKINELKKQLQIVRSPSETKDLQFQLSTLEKRRKNLHFLNLVEIPPNAKPGLLFEGPQIPKPPRFTSLVNPRSLEELSRNSVVVFMKNGNTHLVEVRSLGMEWVKGGKYQIRYLTDGPQMNLTGKTRWKAGQIREIDGQQLSGYLQDFYQVPQTTRKTTRQR